MPKRKAKKQADAPPDHFLPMPVKTLKDVEGVALLLLHRYRPHLEMLQAARLVLDVCKGGPEESMSEEARKLSEQMTLAAWDRIQTEEDWPPVGPPPDRSVETLKSLIAADTKRLERLLHQTEVDHKNLNSTNINLIRTAKRLLPDVWERLEILPVGPPAQDLDAAERDWKRLVKAAGAERARQERDEKAVKGGQGEGEDLQPTLGGKSLQDVSATQEAKEYDAFLCHASEDKDAIVRPFAEAMEQQGLKPWFDKAEVRWGDSLVNKINHGLSRSKLVVVFVSPDFLGKKAWSEKEFNAAVSMEVNGKTVVLPLLCGVTRDQIQLHYPVISDKVYREVPEYTAASKTEPSRLESLVRELKQRIAEPG